MPEIMEGRAMARIDGDFVVFLFWNADEQAVESP